MRVEIGEALRAGPSTGEAAPGARATERRLTIGTPPWEQLYTELGGRVFRLLCRLTGDTELAEDLTHDTFVRAYTRAHQYTGRGSRNGWIFRIATNVARDALRRRRLRTMVEALLGRDATPLRHHDGPELRITLQRAVARLPAKQRAILLLHDVDGYTHEEIADMLGLAEGSSKAGLSRARARLRQLLVERDRGTP
jgi:RNA polymerase sigma-70 factor (ECF subfamily)